MKKKKKIKYLYMCACVCVCASPPGSLARPGSAARLGRAEPSSRPAPLRSAPAGAAAGSARSPRSLLPVPSPRLRRPRGAGGGQEALAGGGASGGQRPGWGRRGPVSPELRAGSRSPGSGRGGRERRR